MKSLVAIEPQLNKPNYDPKRRRLRRPVFLTRGRHLTFATCVALVLHLHQSSADDLTVEALGLQALRVNGHPTKAHTQGLEIQAGKYYVTARRDDVMPKRALLLRTDARGGDWDVWDITPDDARGAASTLDHPGGMQSDGDRLWIPVAESRRKERSVIRVFPMASMVAGQPLKAEFEFPVDDHIGAVAVDAGRKVVFGANWDTEAVYVWDFEGRLQRTLSGRDLEDRGLGVVSDADGRAGLAVQDWKMVGDRLFASGLFRGPGVVPGSTQSRLVIFAGFSEPGFQRWSVTLPKQNGTELAREAMAISDGLVYFLPEDLGASNRIFRVPLADLMSGSGSQGPPAR
ncbi:MAG: hypothetical protein HYY24_17645 [Verrucomicrobia bacterium]|nr:hypothetical protein [Verrucomicrobiota bacterium]